jgi:hypothetical protein
MKDRFTGKVVSRRRKRQNFLKSPRTRGLRGK